MATELDIREAIRHLSEFFEQPRGRTTDDVVAAWLHEFEKVSRDEILHAAEVCRKTREYWPKPVHLWSAIKDLRADQGGQQSPLERAYWTWERAGRHGPCPVCGSVLESWERRPGVYRTNIRHDQEQHREACIPYTGERTGPTVDGRMVKQAQSTTERVAQ